MGLKHAYSSQLECGSSAAVLARVDRQAEGPLFAVPAPLACRGAIHRALAARRITSVAADNDNSNSVASGPNAVACCIRVDSQDAAHRLDILCQRDTDKAKANVAEAVRR